MSGIPLKIEGVPLEGAPIPFFHHKKGCPVVCRVAEAMCASMNDDKCKKKVEEVKGGKLRLKDFLNFMQENYDREKVQDSYINAVSNIFDTST